MICASEIKRKDDKALKERSEIKIAEMRIIIIVMALKRGRKIRGTAKHKGESL